MEFYATFTLLIDGATWGTREEVFEAETKEEAFEIIREWSADHETRREEYLLDYLDTEEGEEIDTSEYYDYLSRGEEESAQKKALPF